MPTRRMPILLSFIAVLVLAHLLLGVQAAPVTEGQAIRGEYRQNESLEVVATILNYDNRTLTLSLFNLTIVRAKPAGGKPKPLYNYTRNLDVKLKPNEGYTIRVLIDLSALPPDKYNLTAYFQGGYEALTTDKFYVYKDAQFQLLPSIKIPPVVWAVVFIMSAIIVVYVGYGIAGRIRR